MINLFQPSLGSEELSAVQEVFESGWLGAGRRTDEFERAFAAHLGVDGNLVCATNSCTEGLFLAVDLLELGPGDEVVLPTISFVGAGNAVAASGARPVFCDVDRRTLNPTMVHVEERISHRTRAIIVLHYGGNPSDIDQLADLADRYGLSLIEDSACSISSRLGAKACGTFGRVGAWSFDAMKTLVTGDGGMLYLDNEELAEHAREQTHLGLSARSGLANSGEKDRWWEFQISSFARRSVMNDVTAALGLVQLRKLPQFIQRRREIWEYYNSELADLEWLTVPPPPRTDAVPSFYMYWIQTESETRDRLARYLLENGIYSSFRYYPLHLVERYGAGAHLPEAEAAALETLCIPLHQALSDAEIEAVVARIAGFEAQEREGS